MRVGPSDEELLSAMRSGDRESFGLLVARWERSTWLSTSVFLGLVALRL